jgi:maltokinase
MSALTDGLTEWLPAWLPQQRWYAHKGAPIDAVRVISSESIVDGDPALDLVIVAVEGSPGTEYYQLPIGSRTGDLDEHLEQFTIGSAGGRVVYDGTADSELTSTLIEMFGHRAGFLLEGENELSPARARLLTAEQSNTSLVFGDRYILKLFRRLVIGENRDLELHRALAAAGSSHIAPPVGSIVGAVPEGPVVLGLLQRFLPDSVDAWDMATASVRDLMAEGDLHAEEVGGDFAGEARRLGVAVADVHADLARIGGDHRGSVAEAVAGMHTRLHAVAADVPDLQAFVPAAAAIFDAILDTADSLAVQQIHGDLHLGQVLRTTAGWVLIDFEGEPAAALAQRHALRSPLVDIAGMLRSFDYAAHQPIALGTEGNHPEHQAFVRAREWAVRNIDAFCLGYASVAADPRADLALLRALELDKAIYEVGYEHGHRPAWLPIPLAAVERLVS